MNTVKEKLSSMRLSGLRGSKKRRKPDFQREGFKNGAVEKGG